MTPNMAKHSAAPHTQSYLGTSNFHLFGPPKWHLYMQKFVNNHVTAVMTWLCTLEQDSFVKCFSAPVSCWNKYLNRCDYVEKQCYNICMGASCCIFVVINACWSVPVCLTFQNVPHATLSCAIFSSATGFLQLQPTVIICIRFLNICILQKWFWVILYVLIYATGQQSSYSSVEETFCILVSHCYMNTLLMLCVQQRNVILNDGTRHSTLTFLLVPLLDKYRCQKLLNQGNWN